MPIYEYKCQACGKVFEKLILSGGKEEDVRCPECSCDNLKKLVSAPFLPSSVGKPANDTTPGSCCGSSPDKEKCQPGSCCGKDCN